MISRMQVHVVPMRNPQVLYRTPMKAWTRRRRAKMARKRLLPASVGRYVSMASSIGQVESVQRSVSSGFGWNVVYIFGRLGQVQ